MIAHVKFLPLLLALFAAKNGVDAASPLCSAILTMAAVQPDFNFTESCTCEENLMCDAVDDCDMNEDTGVEECVSSSANVTGTLTAMVMKTCGNYTEKGFDVICSDLQGGLNDWTSCDSLTYGGNPCSCETCNNGKGLMVDCGEFNENATSNGCAEATLMQMMTSGDSMDMSTFFGRDDVATDDSNAASGGGGGSTSEVGSAGSSTALCASAVVAAFAVFAYIL